MYYNIMLYVYTPYDVVILDPPPPPLSSARSQVYILIWFGIKWDNMGLDGMGWGGVYGME